MRVHRLVQGLLVTMTGEQGARTMQNRIYDLLRMIVRDEAVGLEYTTAVDG